MNVVVDPSSARRLRALLAGLLAALTLTAFGAATASPATASEHPDWWSYHRVATSEAIHREVRVPMRDGVRLGCVLSRPALHGKALPGKFPGLIYEVTPYPLQSFWYQQQGEWFARRGYVALMCTVRGTGKSGGSFPQPNQPLEALDGFDTVEWLAAQPFSTGKVGQSGESYGGMTAYRTAGQRPPHLAAIAPQQSSNDLYLDDAYPGGVQHTPGTGAYWPYLLSLTSLGRVSTDRILRVEAAHPRRDAFWKQIAIEEIVDQIDVPVLAFGGWEDPLFRSGAMRTYQQLRVADPAAPHFLVYGPWAHSEVIAWPSCRYASIGCAQREPVPPGALLAWFDHWVAGRPEAPLPSARVTSFQGPLAGGSGWRELDDFPPSDSTPVRLALQPGGALEAAAATPAAATQTGAGPAEPAGPSGSATFRHDPLDGLIRRPPSILFTTAPLTAPRDLAGGAAVDLRFSATGTDANLFAELLEVRANGSRKVLGDGWLRASHRASHEHPTPLVPGQVTSGRIALPPNDVRLPAGARLAVRLSGGSALQGIPTKRPVTVRVFTGAGGSSLSVDVRGGTL